MPDITFIGDDVRTASATVEDGKVLVEPAQLRDALGWTLEPDGLCRGDVCVSVRDRVALFVDGRLDVERVAGALGRPVVADPEAGVVAIALPAEQRRAALDTLVAPSFELDDLHGVPHPLDQWRGTKKLLVAFASW
jgi:hypothetical protein